MTLGMGMPDFFGSPQFFVNRVIKCESAGHGNIRIYCCSIRGNEVVPELSIIMSIEELMVATVFVKHCAAELWNREQLIPDFAH
jgi:hypothetical protein